VKYVIALSRTDLRPEVMIKKECFSLLTVKTFFEVVVSVPDVILVSDRPTRPLLVLIPIQNVILEVNFD
jgi:hypothetical protein